MKTRVRMYRQGLGDCFLLSFDLDKPQPRHVLVDCGLLLGGDSDRVRAAVEHVAQTTGGRIDVLAVTHEHWDHVSGFVQAQAAFDGLEVGEGWFAWTEDPDDPQGKALREAHAMRVAGLSNALVRWRAALGAGQDEGLEVADSLLGLFGAGGATTRDAMAYALKKGERRRFLEPGKTFKLGSVRVYVLGPPRDERFIRKDLPTKKAPETYSLTERGGVSAAFLAAANTGGPGGGRRPDGFRPFDEWQQVTVGAAWPEYTKADRWRNIDAEWLRGAEELALQLDSDTNNTSLVLAFELSYGGDVILMAADAQVGNWLSWQDVSFTVRKKRVTTNDLLARTVLYKVGHHGSHNATLREHGLEKMTHPGLTAMIPVDHEMAEKQRWHMPFGPLYTRLQELTRGRVLRVDAGVPKGVGGLDGAQEDPLYVDLVLG